MALPSRASEVAAVITAAADADVAVVPFGGNTGLAGGATPDSSGRQLVLSLERMTAIRHLDAVGATIEAEAGCILKAAQDRARAVGFCLPISIASEGSATIGGIISTNAGGSNVLRYGMTRSRVLGLEVVTSEGTIISGLRHLQKDNAGYDWKQLFIGSEGTLGVVTAAVLQMEPVPQFTETALVAFDGLEGVMRVFAAARSVLHGALTSFELISGASMELVRRHAGIECPLLPAGWYVLLEASSSLGGLREAMERTLTEALEEGHASDAVVAESGRHRAALWRVRESISEAEAREGSSEKHDVAVPISVIPDFLQQAYGAVREAYPQARINAFGHVGDGNIHFNVLPGVQGKGQEINSLIHSVATAYGGTISAEHGVGQYRVHELARCRSEQELSLAARIKSAFDPAGRLNPGKVVTVSGAVIGHAAI